VHGAPGDLTLSLPAARVQSQARRGCWWVALGGQGVRCWGPAENAAGFRGVNEVTDVGRFYDAVMEPPDPRLIPLGPPAPLPICKTAGAPTGGLVTFMHCGEGGLFMELKDEASSDFDKELQVPQRRVGL
jgi:hypothetical protein